MGVDGFNDETRDLVDSVMERMISRRTMLQAAAIAVGAAGAMSGSIFDAMPAQATDGLTVNGWPIIPSQPDPRLAWISAGGHGCSVRAGNVAVLLTYVAQQYHTRVERLASFSGWRDLATNTASGGIANSNHMSGTAIDLNSHDHPRHENPVLDYSSAQIAAIAAICAETSATIRWGGTFPAADWDGMHFEIAPGMGEAQVAAAVTTLGYTPPTPPDQTMEDDMAFTATGPDGQNWLISGPFRRPITAAQRDALTTIAAPATIPYLQGIGADMLAAFADIGGGYRPVTTAG